MGHKTQEELQKGVEVALGEVKVGGMYYHYKHPEKYYVVEFVGVLENSEEVCVGYRALYGKGILWVRTLENFLEGVEIDGKSVKRFQVV
ncbi:MAG TPA: DUF1653 domain-containing protein [Patescibacteria group bacterium]|nr:DUF1653 domain-containing protein [Patescibacteria group bacterium]